MLTVFIPSILILSVVSLCRVLLYRMSWRQKGDWVLFKYVSALIAPLSVKLDRLSLGKLKIKSFETKLTFLF